MDLQDRVVGIPAYLATYRGVWSMSLGRGYYNGFEIQSIISNHIFRPIKKSLQHIIYTLRTIL